MKSKHTPSVTPIKKSDDAMTMAHIYDLVDNILTKEYSHKYWHLIDLKKNRHKTILQKRYQMAMRKMRSRWQNAQKPNRRSQSDPMLAFPELQPYQKDDEQYKTERLNTSLALNLNDLFYQLRLPFEVSPNHAQETSLFMLKISHMFLSLRPDLSKDSRVQEQQEIFYRLCQNPLFRCVNEQKNISQIRRAICHWDVLQTQGFHHCHIRHVQQLFKQGHFSCSKLESQFKDCVDEARSAMSPKSSPVRA